MRKADIPQEARFPGAFTAQQAVGVLYFDAASAAAVLRPARREKPQEGQAKQIPPEHGAPGFERDGAPQKRW